MSKFMAHHIRTGPSRSRKPTFHSKLSDNQQSFLVIVRHFTDDKQDTLCSFFAYNLRGSQITATLLKRNTFAAALTMALQMVPLVKSNR
jgi:hypothetical protein